MSDMTDDQVMDWVQDTTWDHQQQTDAQRRDIEEMENQPLLGKRIRAWFDDGYKVTGRVTSYIGGYPVVTVPHEGTYIILNANRIFIYPEKI